MLKTVRVGSHEAGNLKHGVFLVFFMILWMNLSTSRSVAGVIPICPMCGNTSVPYPFSTGDDCGVSDYRIYCNAANGNLELKSVNGSFYKIVSINPATMKLVIQPSPLMNNSCQTRDMTSTEGLHLNQSLPFNITNTNTIMLLNCDPVILRAPLNCSSSSLCHRYMEESMACRNDSICCTFIGGSSTSSRTIRVQPGGCTAYTSVLNFNPALPPGEWSYGVEIQWAAPLEPFCRTQADCDQNSACSPDPVDSRRSRCLCIGDYIWDPVQGNCTENVSVCIDSNGCGNKKRGALIGGLVAGMCVAIAVATLVTILYRRKRQQMRTQARLMKERADILSANSGGKSAKLFTRKEMKRATNGFARDRVLGSGGFGEVYKGILNDGTVVAVKTAKVGNIKGIEQVLNEVRILSQVNHRNLVRLTACCVDTEEPLLVYEYIPNGTLYDHLHMSIGENFLDLRTRLNIALHTAEALAYLHSSAFPPIYHRDVKSTNILLDNQLNAKVSDFGLSRLAETDLSHISTCAQGTLGYLDPEYYRNYQLTDKSDVYSFGVVLLELVTSQKAIDFSREPDDVNLAMYVLSRSEQGRIMDVVDPRLKENASQIVLDTMKAVVLLALGCLQEKRQERPTMKEVAEELHYIMSVEASGVVVEDRDNTSPSKISGESGFLLGPLSYQSSTLFH